MAGMAAGLTQSLGNQGSRLMDRVSQLSHDPHGTLFVDWAGGPAVIKLPLHQPMAGSPMHHMALIQQGNHHVDVEQCRKPQIMTSIAQFINLIMAHELAALGGERAKPRHPGGQFIGCSP